MNSTIERVLMAALLTTTPLVALAPPVMADAPCAGNTSSDTMNCSGHCTSWQNLGVWISLNDQSGTESGNANTSCSTASAACSTHDSCSATSATSTQSTGGPWTCHFEAHDAWYYPDNGFGYNCYQFSCNCAPPNVKARIVPQLIPAGSGGVLDLPFCGELSGTARGDALAAFCNAIHSSTSAEIPVMLGATSQLIFYASEAGVAGVQCDSALHCVPLIPDCSQRNGAIVCEASPVRLG